MISESYETLVEYLAIIGGLLVFVMSSLTTADIIGRTIIAASVPGCYELVQYMMVFVVFFALAYVQSQKGNVRVELLYSRFSKWAQTAVNLVSSIAALFVFCLIVYASGIYSWESWISKETMHDLHGGPLYVWKFGVPFGCMFMCIQLVVGIVKTIKQSIEVN